MIWGPNRIMRATNLARNGMTAQQIADRLGCDVSAVIDHRSDIDAYGSLCIFETKREIGHEQDFENSGTEFNDRKRG